MTKRSTKPHRSKRKVSHKKHSKVTKLKSATFDSNSITLPTTSEVKKMCKEHGLESIEADALQKLKEAYRTFTYKIVRNVLLAVETRKKRSVTENDIIPSLNSLFGTKFSHKLDERSTIVDSLRFKRMVVEVLDILVSRLHFPGRVLQNLVQTAIETALIKGFIAPAVAWLKDEDTRKGTPIKLTIEILRKINQVHLVSNSEFYAPSVVSTYGSRVSKNHHTRSHKRSHKRSKK